VICYVVSVSSDADGPPAVAVMTVEMNLHHIVLGTERTASVTVFVAVTHSTDIAHRRHDRIKRAVPRTLIS